jgi:hypothetical protein
MSMTTTEPAAPWAGFYSDPGELALALTPTWLQAAQRAEMVDRAEAREREERIAERQDRAYQLAVAEAITRAHVAGEQWNPADPLKHYPPTSVRMEEAFAWMDMEARANARQAKREAAAVLAAAGVQGQVTIDVESPASSGPAAVGGESGSPPAARSDVKSRIRRALMRMGHLRDPREAHPTITDGWWPDGPIGPDEVAAAAAVRAERIREIVR